ncbi:hypothetical protein [Bradyrhizobium sp. Ghvi]|uniref:hypothetical protein n=1 Tax=Bradyrhizobium sp. Ghvi TaxID=1855319 RepID=UPI0032DEB375
MASPISHLNGPSVAGGGPQWRPRSWRYRSYDALEAFTRWQAAGLPFCFVTNISTHTSGKRRPKLEAFGLAIAPDEAVYVRDCSRRTRTGEVPGREP